MPRSVKEVVKDLEKLSSPPKAPRMSSTPPRRRLSIPATTQAGPSIVHPLLRASVSPQPAPRTNNAPVNSPVVLSLPEPSPVSPIHVRDMKPLTISPRLDESISLSPSYNSSSSLTLSGASSSTKHDGVVDFAVPIPARPPIIAHQYSSEYHAISIPDTSYPPPTLSTLDSMQPIEGEQLFSRNAPVLSLSALDDYLAQIPAPNFSPIPDSSTVTAPTEKPSSALSIPRMFPPLQELSKGKSLADLMYNRSVTPSWRNRNSIFGFVSVERITSSVDRR